MNTLAARARSWLREEKPNTDGHIVVHGRRIYILPTRYGLLFGALLFLMLIGSLNYDNNPAYLLTFLLIGLSLNAMLQTWRNLKGIDLHMQASPPGHVGKAQKLHFVMGSSDQRSHYAISLQLSDSAVVEDIRDKPQHLQLHWQPKARGWQQPGQQLVLATRYPLGLFRAWCRVRLNDQILVYPQPDDFAAASTQLAFEKSGKQVSTQSGSEDFHGLREYRQGDSARQIDWKSLARERGLMSKSFHDTNATAVLLEWNAQQSTDTELRLSRLTRAVLDLEAAGHTYTLSLPGQQIGPSQGRTHQHQCLRALALFREVA